MNWIFVIMMIIGIMLIGCIAQQMKDDKIDAEVGILGIMLCAFIVFLPFIFMSIL